MQDFTVEFTSQSSSDIVKLSSLLDPCQAGEELPAGGTGSNDCTRCPLNTYKTSQDVTCQSCPDKHFTSETGSTTVDECIRKSTLRLSKGPLVFCT